MRKLKTLRRSRKKKDLDLDINSLLDILVILLVFLLKSYSASQVEIKVPEKLDIPTSASQDYGHQIPTVLVTKDGKIFVNEEMIAERSNRKLDGEGKIVQLFNKLNEIKEMNKGKFGERENKIDPKVLEKLSDKEKEKALLGKSINLVFDKELDYEDMQHIMYTSSFSGYGKFKLLVQAEN